ncbi:MAG: ABC transporter permease [Alphaproteobacteria bacterium]|nr:ABC transporter permease [Alphaproteobacteria bacterium]
MTLRLLAQLARALGTVLGAAFLLLVGLELAPGGPADLVADPAVADVLSARWGLDRPIPVRAFDWLARVLTGDLGTSWAYRPGAPVWEVVQGPLQRTAGLLVLAFPVAVMLASLPRRLGSLVVLVSALPVFLLAHLVVEGANASAWAAMSAGWLDRPGWFALPGVDHPVRTALAAVVLAVGSNVGGDLWTDMQRARDALQRSDFAAVARVHDTPGPGWKHAVLVALPVLSGRLPMVLGGCVVLERVFLVNGAGWVLWEAAMARDFELAMALGLVAAAVVATVTLVAESARVLLDPRLRELP